MASSVWRVTFMSLEMTREDFEGMEVYLSCNPVPESGYAHGMIRSRNDTEYLCCTIPDRNTGWLPHSVLERLAATGRQGKITLAGILDGLQRNPPGKPMLPLNKVNGLCCDIAVSRDGTMCGLTYNTQNELRKHLRNKHPSTIRIITCRPQTDEQDKNGRNALKRWVLSRGWRYAKYLNEPGRGFENSLIRQYCHALERLAREDPEFARKYGTQFHRRSSVEISALAETASTGEAPGPTEPNYGELAAANYEDPDWNAVLASLQETKFDDFDAMAE